MSNRDRKGKQMPKTNNAKKVRDAAIQEDQIEEMSDIKGVVEGIAKETKPTVDEKGRKTVVGYSMEELDGKGLKNKSQTIRFLLADGYSPSAIAKFLNIRYQFVRNVSVQPLKRQSNS